MRRPSLCSLLASAVLGLSPLLFAQPACAGYDTYLALGDSLAFGEGDFQHNPSDGNRGYVSQLDGYLTQFNGGITPSVVNLGVDGETTSTFFQYSGAAGSGPEPGKPAYTLNTNYNGLASPTQHQLMSDVITASQAAGHTIGAVTIQLGANDLFVLASDPAFFAKTPAEQTAAVADLMMNSIAPHLGALVTELETRLPGATIALLGYYDPYAPFVGASDPSLDALARAAGPAIAALNQTIAAVALQTGVRFIDIASSFQGSAALAANTHVLDPIAPGLPGPNIHPTQAGYDAIFSRLQSVPEPGSLVLLGVGSTVGLLGFLRKSRRAVA